MAKLPKKITTNETTEKTTLRHFISTATHKPATASAVTRINLTVTHDDLVKTAEFQQEGAISRADVFRAALVALDDMPKEARQSLFDEIRKASPKAGRPPVNK